MHSLLKQFFLWGILFIGISTLKGMSEITLKTNDGVQFTLERSSAEQSTVLLNMINDTDENNAEEASELSEIGSVEFGIIASIFALLAQNNQAPMADKVAEVFKNLDALKLSNEMLITILNSANCLNCEALLDGCAQVIARNIMVQFKTTNIEVMQQWCSQFNIPYELSMLIGKHLAQRYNLLHQAELSPLLYEALKNRIVSSYSFSNDKNLLVVALDGCSEIKVWNIKDGTLVSSLPCRTCVKAFSFSPNNEKLAVASEDNVVRIWQLNTQKCRRVNAVEGVESIAYSYDGSKIVGTSHKGNKWIVQEWSVDSLECKQFRSNCECPVKYDGNGKIVLDQKIIAYKSIIHSWHLKSSALQDEILSLPIEGILFVRWALELIGKGKKIDLCNKPEIQEIFTQLILNQRPSLQDFLQNHLVLNKSNCAIS